MSDVAMHIHHAVLPEDLANGRGMVKYYWKSLQDLLNQQHPAENYQYSYDEAWRIIDNRSSTTFAFFVAWKTATPESMQLKADKEYQSSIDQPAAMAFVARVDQYLAEIEQERRPPELLTQT
jgi:hypothetical protein